MSLHSLTSGDAKTADTNDIADTSDTNDTTVDSSQKGLDAERPLRKSVTVTKCSDSITVRFFCYFFTPQPLRFVLIVAVHLLS